MNKRQALVATIAAPVIAFVVLLPPHRVTGSVEARSGQDADVVSLSRGKTWVLRPLGSDQSVTLDIDASVFTAISHREYKLMVLPWFGSLFAVFVLAGGALFFLRSPAPKPAVHTAPAPTPAPEPAARTERAPAARKQERIAPLPPDMTGTGGSRKNTWTITDLD